MHTPFFSIIIPAYNAAKDIATALGSVCGQQFQDFEVVVMDGVSTDNTAAIVQSLAENDSRIRLIIQKDTGIYDAMNKGLSQSKGKWIYFLGSDDVLHDDGVLKKIAEFLQKDQADLWYGDVLIMPGSRKYGGIFSSDTLLYRNISHQAIFYKRDIFERVGLYNLSYRKHADWDFNIRCFELPGIRTQHRDVVVAEFREGQTSAGHDVPFLLDVLIPRKLEDIRLRPQQLRKVNEYDYCWRLFRNAAFGRESNGGDQVKNKILKAMLRFQKRIPLAMLKNGFVSKFFMFISYLLSLFIKARQ